MKKPQHLAGPAGAGARKIEKSESSKTREETDMAEGTGRLHPESKPAFTPSGLAHLVEEIARSVEKLETSQPILRRERDDLAGFIRARFAGPDRDAPDYSTCSSCRGLRSSLEAMREHRDKLLAELTKTQLILEQIALAVTE